MLNEQLNSQKRAPDESQPPARYSAARYSEAQRHFSDKETTAILKRAMELQQSDALIAEGGRGMTLADLEKIAAEVGIDPQYVQTAAAELEIESSPQRFNLWGGPMDVHLERTVEGEVSQAQWDTLLAEIRRSVGEVGAPRMVGNSLEWVYDPGLVEHLVTVTPREGQTTIRVTSQIGGLALLSYFSAFIISFVGAMALTKGLPFEPLLELVMSSGVFVTLFGVVRFLMSALGRKEKRRMQELLNRLASLVAQSTPPASEQNAEVAKRLIPAESINPPIQ
jgi:hypothetical protein